MERIVEFGHKLEGVEYKDREAVYGLLVKDECIAVVATPRGIFLPGGGIEQGETDEVCLMREMIEEVGLEVEIGEFIGKSVLYGRSVKDQVYYNLYGSYYLVEAIKNVKKMEEDHEMIWMPLEEAKERLKLSHQVWAVEALLTKRSS